MSNQSTQIQISAVIITRNEERNIARCLRALDFVDEILIYDSGSADNTLKIARELSGKAVLKIVEGPWLGFGPTKNKATALATHPWILSVDADEVISAELKQELLQFSPALSAENSFFIPRRSFYLNRWINHGGWYPDYQLRFFNKTKWQWDQALIHEKVVPVSAQYRSEKLKNDMHHFVFRDIEHQVNTNNRYSTLQAEKLFSEGKRFSWFHFLTKPGVKFFECYFWKLGFVDGWPGFVIAKSAAYSVFLKWAKLKELRESKQQGRS